MIIENPKDNEFTFPFLLALTLFTNFDLLHKKKKKKPKFLVFHAIYKKCHDPTNLVDRRDIVLYLYCMWSFDKSPS